MDISFPQRFRRLFSPLISTAKCGPASAPYSISTLQHALPQVSTNVFTGRSGSLNNDNTLRRKLRSSCGETSLIHGLLTRPAHSHLSLTVYVACEQDLSGVPARQVTGGRPLPSSQTPALSDQSNKSPAVLLYAFLISHHILFGTTPALAPTSLNDTKIWFAARQSHSVSTCLSWG